MPVFSVSLVQSMYASGLKGDQVVAALLMVVGGVATNAALGAIIPKSERRVRDDAAKARAFLRSDLSPDKNDRGNVVTTTPFGESVSIGEQGERSNGAWEGGPGETRTETAPQRPTPVINGPAAEAAEEVVIAGANFVQVARAIASVMRKHLRPGDGPKLVGFVKAAAEATAAALEAGEVAKTPIQYFYGVLRNVMAAGRTVQEPSVTDTNMEKNQGAGRKQSFQKAPTKSNVFLDRPQQDWSHVTESLPWLAKLEAACGC